MVKENFGKFNMANEEEGKIKQEEFLKNEILENYKHNKDMTISDVLEKFLDITENNERFIKYLYDLQSFNDGLRPIKCIEESRRLYSFLNSVNICNLQEVKLSWTQIFKDVDIERKKIEEKRGEICKMPGGVEEYLDIKSIINEARNNKGEIIYSQIVVQNYPPIYIGWGANIFEKDGLLYKENNSHEVKYLPKELSEKLLKIKWAEYDHDEEFPEFPDGLFTLCGVKIPDKFDSK